MANYGIINHYKITLNNLDGRDRTFSFKIFSSGQHIYKTNVLNSKNESYATEQTFKKAYVDVTEGGETEEYIDVLLKADTTTVIEIDLTMTTGCNGTIQNSFIALEELEDIIVKLQTPRFLK